MDRVGPADYYAARAYPSVESRQVNELTRNSPGNARPQSSRLTTPPLTDPGPKESGTATSLWRLVGVKNALL